ncbi:MAG: ABC transporter substrate-binding protein, partial [Rhizobiaceae bacterium]
MAPEPTSLDPHFHNLTPNSSLASHIFDSLVIGDEHYRLKPGLAVSWKLVDKTNWEFKLRKGVSFHDGSPFTADDVLFSFARAPDVPNSPSSFASFIKGKTLLKVDSHTIRIKTSNPHLLMPIDMSRVPIVSKKHGLHAKTEDYNSGKAVIGTGPFVLKEYVPGDRIVLRKNPDYWDEKTVWEQVVFRPIKSGPARLAALLAGDVDMIDSVPTADISGLKSSNRVKLFQTPSSRIIYFHMDRFRDHSPFIRSKSGEKIANPLKKLKVRQALSLAINRDAIVSNVMEGVAVKAG